MQIGDEYFDIVAISPDSFEVHCRNKVALFVFKREGEWYVSDEGSLMKNVPAEVRKALKDLVGVVFTADKFEYRIRNGRVSEAMFYILPILSRIIPSQ